MELIRGLHNLSSHYRPSVVVLGNFDGVHLGHQALLRLGARLADARATPLTVVTFEPHPREYFRPADAPPRLSDLRDKLAEFARHGCRRTLCLPFNSRLAGMTAMEFVDRVLVRGLGAEAVVVGEDFRFGRDRQGDAAVLCRQGEEAGFQVEVVHDQCTPDGIRVSSSRIRAALATGAFDVAEVLLGRRFSVSGNVVHGDARGRQLGFPTANLHLGRRRLPIAGVFAVTVQGLTEKPCQGVAHVGTRPVFGDPREVLEVHVFDYAGECYGRRLSVTPIEQLREVVRFTSVAALQAQIQRDIGAARGVLKMSAAEVPDLG